jgi:hypothetical protein
MEDENRRPASRSVNADAAIVGQRARDVAHEGAVEQPRRSGWDFPDEFVWTEIAEAVARSMAEDTQFPQAPSFDLGLSDGSDRFEAGVDPAALAGLDEAVGRIHDANMSGRDLALRARRLPLDQQQPRGCRRTSTLNVGDFNVSDVVGIAHAVLRSLDEDAMRVMP